MLYRVVAASANKKMNDNACNSLAKRKILL